LIFILWVLKLQVFCLEKSSMTPDFCFYGIKMVENPVNGMTGKEG